MTDRVPFVFGRTMYVYIDKKLYFLGSWGWERWFCDPR